MEPENKKVNNLINIQVELRAPKNQYNNFGKYNYRTCEGILEAVKPLLKLYNCQLTLTDDIIAIGSRCYVRATATFIDGDKVISVTGWAREEEVKKGMDASQITGTASSYARKYALDGLFLIDDANDADTPAYARVSYTKEDNNADELQGAILQMQQADTLKDAYNVWDIFSKKYGNDESFIKAKEEKKKQLTEKK
jgi:hypothetical protein